MGRLSNWSVNRRNRILNFVQGRIPDKWTRIIGLDAEFCIRSFPWFINYILSVPYITANLHCICLSACFMFAQADAVQICGKFWDIRQLNDSLCARVDGKFYVRQQKSDPVKTNHSYVLQKSTNEI